MTPTRGRCCARNGHRTPTLTEVDPAVWWSAYEQASSGLLDDVAAIAVGGQQHGMVLVDDAGTPVREALLWNDNRSAGAAEELIDELGGPQAWADAHRPGPGLELHRLQAALGGLARARCRGGRRA